MRGTWKPKKAKNFWSKSCLRIQKISDILIFTSVEFLSDNEKKIIVREEEPGLRPSVRYRRYKVLFDSDYMFYGSVEERIEADSPDWQRNEG